MVCSPKQLAANQANAKRSTGPKDTSRTRLNAFKHGLTASGIALPSEDQAEIERRCRDLNLALNPTNEVAAILVRRFAFLSVRLDRCQRYDVAMQSYRDRHAEATYTEARMKQVEAYSAQLQRDPVTISRLLRAMPEGLQFLGLNLMELRERLEGKAHKPWAMSDVSDLDDLMGEPTGSTRFNRTLILSQAICGYFDNLPAGEWPSLTDAEKSEAARTELLAVIDSEMAGLKKLHDEFDHDAHARDRIEAADRALFDPSKDAELSRKYEASTERSLFRTLRELGQLDRLFAKPTSGPEPEPEAPTPPGVADDSTSWLRGSLASFFPMTPPPISTEETRPVTPSEATRIVPEGPPTVIPEPFSADRE